MLRNNVVVKSLVASIILASGLVGCASSGGASASNRPAPVELPVAAKSHASLTPLSFLQGRWVRMNPNGSMNEETWSPAYGNSMLGVFRQIRRDGKPALFEISLVTVQETGVQLSLRHLHAGLEVPEKRKDLDIFTLASADGTSATFAGTGSSDGMKVTYTRTSPRGLTQSIDFPEGSPEKDFSMEYVLGGDEVFTKVPPPLARATPAASPQGATSPQAAPTTQAAPSPQKP